MLIIPLGKLPVQATTLRQEPPSLMISITWLDSCLVTGCSVASAHRFECAWYVVVMQVLFDLSKCILDCTNRPVEVTRP